MEDKTKFIIIALAGVLIISLYINLKSHNSLKGLQSEMAGVEEKEALLTRQIEEKTRDNQRLQDEKRSLTFDIDKLRADMEKINNDKQELQKKYETLGKERDGLTEKLKLEQAKPQEEARKELDVQPSAGQDAYWGRLLRSKAELEAQLEKTRSDLKSIQINNEQIQKEKSNLELELGSLTHEKQDLKNELIYHKQNIDSVAAEVAREKNASRQYQESLKFVKSENMILRRQVKSLSDYKVELEKKLVKLQEEKSSFERRFNEMGTLLEDKMSRLTDIKDKIDAVRSGQEIEAEKESVELPPIVVRPQTQTQEESVSKQTQVEELPLVGNILAIDKENNFAIVDLGEDSGIKTGETLQAFRRDKKVATLEVIQVRKKIAACDIKKEFTPITVGDRVMQ